MKKKKKKKEKKKKKKKKKGGGEERAKIYCATPVYNIALTAAKPR